MIRSNSWRSTASWQTCGYEDVVPRSPVVLGRTPFGLHPAVQQQSLQGRVEGALANLEHLLGDVLEVLGDAVPVPTPASRSGGSGDPGCRAGVQGCLLPSTNDGGMRPTRHLVKLASNAVTVFGKAEVSMILNSTGSFVCWDSVIPTLTMLLLGFIPVLVGRAAPGTTARSPPAWRSGSRRPLG